MEMECSIWSRPTTGTTLFPSCSVTETGPSRVMWITPRAHRPCRWRWVISIGMACWTSLPVTSSRTRFQFCWATGTGHFRITWTIRRSEIPNLWLLPISMGTASWTLPFSAKIAKELRACRFCWAMGMVRFRALPAIPTAAALSTWNALPPLTI